MQYACPNLKVLMPNEVLEIIDSCLQIFPSKRPSTFQLLSLLANITGNSNLKLNVTQTKSGLDESLYDLKGNLFLYLLCKDYIYFRTYTCRRRTKSML